MCDKVVERLRQTIAKTEVWEKQRGRGKRGGAPMAMFDLCLKDSGAAVWRMELGVRWRRGGGVSLGSYWEDLVEK